jgi:hypothetical protein
VLAFSVAVALATGVLAGLAPLWQAARTRPTRCSPRVCARRPRRRCGGCRRRSSSREIALAFTLLTVSAILVVHLQHLGRVSLGFDPMGCSRSTCAPAAASAAPVDAQRRQRATLARVAEQQRLMDALQRTPGSPAPRSRTSCRRIRLRRHTVHVNGRPLDTLRTAVCFVIASPDFLRRWGSRCARDDL